MFKSKICKECGQVFTPKNGHQVYCAGPHFNVCECCGKQFSYKCSPREKPKFCSQSCINEDLFACTIADLSNGYINTITFNMYIPNNM